MIEEKTQPQAQKPKNGAGKTKGPKRDESEDYESGEDQRENVQDYEEERNDLAGETLLEKMQLRERTLQVILNSL